MIRTLCVFVWVFLDTTVMATLAILASLLFRRDNYVHLVAKAWAKSIMVVSRIPVTVTGLSNIDPQKSYIYMPNHQSNYDIPVLLGYLPVQFRWLAKAELFKIPIFGRAMRGAGYISIDRFNRKSAFESMDIAARRIKDGVSVMIFPEGTRSLDGKIRPFKKGGFVLAVDAGVPIVPIIIRGTRSIMPKGRLMINPGTVKMEIGKPIDTSEYTRDTKNELVDHVRSVICDNFYQGS